MCFLSFVVVWSSFLVFFVCLIHVARSIECKMNVFEQVLKVLEGHRHTITDVAITTDGAKIVSGSYDQTVRIWSMKTGEVPYNAC